MQTTVRILLFLLIGVSFFSCDEGTYFNDYKTVNASVVIPDTASASDTLEVRTVDLASDKIDDGSMTISITVNKLEMAFESPQSATIDRLEFLEVYLVNNTEQEKVAWLDESFGAGLSKVELMVNEGLITSFFDESHYHFIIRTKLTEPLETDWSLRLSFKFKIERSDPRFAWF